MMQWTYPRLSVWHSVSSCGRYAVNDHARTSTYEAFYLPPTRAPQLLGERGTPDDAREICEQHAAGEACA